jgi:DNA-binding response OmpR family regulator
MAGPTSPRRVVLVVEDDASIRELLRLHLDLAGFTIDEAGEGRSALERARSTPFDLVLLDVMLPAWTASASAGRSATAARTWTRQF